MAAEGSFSPEAIEAARVLFARPAVFIMGAAQIDQLPDSSLPEVAFAGRSNVGKSSLINALVGRKDLARASGEPGRTREVNFFLLDERVQQEHQPDRVGQPDRRDPAPGQGQPDAEPCKGEHQDGKRRDLSYDPPAKLVETHSTCPCRGCLLRGRG